MRQNLSSKNIFAIVMVAFLVPLLSYSAGNDWFKAASKQEKPETVILEEPKAEVIKKNKVGASVRSPASERFKKTQNSQPSAIRPSQADAPVLNKKDAEDARLQENMGE